MRTRFMSLAAVILVFGCGGRSDRASNGEAGAAADQSGTDTMSSASMASADSASTGGLNWGPAPPALPAGARVAVVSGDPSKAGPFTIRIEMPADYAVRPHTHPTSEKISVVEGTLHFGHGPKWDDKAMKEVPAGGVTIPAKDPHYVHAASRVVVEVQSTGPFVITYVNPKDDPRNTSTH
ncbi:MAG TPA: cupin domain-containing protein [Gemmatimonadales bacterium]